MKKRLALVIFAASGIQIGLFIYLLISNEAVNLSNFYSSSPAIGLLLGGIGFGSFSVYKLIELSREQV